MSRTTITFFEHQFRAYTDLPGFPQSMAARERVLDGIDRINQRAGREILQAGRKGLRAQEQVGMLHVGDLSIEILPKIDAVPEQPLDLPHSGGSIQNTTQSAARNLLWMLHYAYQIPVREQDLDLLAVQPVTWFDLLTRLFVTGLHRQIRSGLSHNYTVKEETLPVLRGKWDIQRQILHHPHQYHIFDTTFDEFSPDIPLNQIFRCVIHKLLSLTQDSENRFLLGELAEWFHPVSDLREIPPPLLDSVHFNRLNERFQPSFNLARLFLSGSAVQPARGDLLACAFVLDMNALFERFVTAFIARHRETILPEAMHDALILPQSEGMRLYLARSEGQPAGRLRPDLLFKSRRAGSIILVADTKYKTLDSAHHKAGILPEDLYQMLAYAAGLNCPRVLLLYPQAAATAPVRKQFTIETIGASLLVSTINMRTPLDRPAVLILELKDIFHRILPGPE